MLHDHSSRPDKDGTVERVIKQDYVMTSGGLRDNLQRAHFDCAPTWSGLRTLARSRLSR
jgi:hypothetical protein